MGKRLAGRIAVVTGGASGIGAGCARTLAAAGAKLVIADIDFALGQAVAAEVGGRAFRLDVCDDAEHAAVAEEIEQVVGPVDIVVTSAGVIQRPLPPHELPIDNIDRIFAVDLRGVFMTCRLFGTRMAQRGAGAICNIASIAGMRSLPLHIYSPCKAAVISLTECLAAEWGASGVRVNVVSPGHTLTPGLATQIARGERDVSLIERNMALHRLVKVEEVANAVCFLCSDEASAITGVNLPVDCGWLAATPWNTFGGTRPAY